MTRARKGIAWLVSLRLSKYSISTDVDIKAIYGQKGRRRILVLGQVEGDALIEKGCIPKIGNNDLVRLAARKNPDNQILIKPHPAVLRGTQPISSIRSTWRISR